MVTKYWINLLIITDNLSVKYHNTHREMPQLCELSSLTFTVDNILRCSLIRFHITHCPMKCSMVQLQPPLIPLLVCKEIFQILVSQTLFIF